MKLLPKIGLVVAIVFASAQMSFAMHADKTFQNTSFPDTTGNSKVKGGCSATSIINIPASPLSENEK